MKSKLIPLFFVFILLLGSVAAMMPGTHTVVDTVAIRTTDSAITRSCSEDLLIAGEKVTDIWVTEYTGSDRNGYIGSHSAESYINGARRASNTEEQCINHGKAMHLIEDYFTAHGPSGIVPVHLKKFFGSNLLWHGIIEQGFERDLYNYMERNPDKYDIPLEEVKQINAHALDIFFEDRTKFDYIQEVEGKDPTFSLNVVDKSLKVANGETGEWFKEVYESELPGWWIGICVGMMILGVFLFILTYLLMKRTGDFSLFTLLFGLIFIILGILLLISILTGKSFLWYQTITSSPWIIGASIIAVGAILLLGAIIKKTQLSYWVIGILLLLVGFYSLVSLNISFTDDQIESVMDLGINKIKNYFETEDLEVKHASGLTFCEKHLPSGVCEKEQTGALNEAEGPFMIVLYCLAGLFSLFIILQIFKVFRGVKR